MTAVTLNTQVTLSLVDCYTCGATFGLAREFNDNRLNDHKTFFCPNGHGQSYSGKTDAEKAREETARVQRALEIERRRRESAEKDAQVADYQARAAKGNLTKIRKRVANGICPCCGRTFVNLLRHMNDKHPDFAQTVDDTTEETQA